MSEVGGQRTGGFALADAEKRLLTRIASRLPRWVLPDDLTALGVVSAIAIATCLALSSLSRFWLLAVIPLLIVHWLGDSLDGTLARVRKITRPRYGYYLDHLVDAFSTILIGLGLGLSPYLDFWVAALAVIAYLVLSINVYLEGEVFDRFEIGYANLGPTEMRLFLAALMLTLFFTGPVLASTLLVFLAADSTLPVRIFGADMPVLNFLVLAIVLFMLISVVIRAVRNLKTLSQEEPSAKRD